jgi:hypothetical protein
MRKGLFVFPAAAVIALALAHVGCSKSPAAATAGPDQVAGAGQQGSAAGTNEDAKTFDLNRDKKPDVWVYFKKGPDPAKQGATKEINLRKEMDLNFDGKIDVWKYFDEATGDMNRECFDLDFDGRIDECAFYEKTILVRKELDLNFDGRPDMFKFFEKGKLVRKERASKGDGKVDYWEYYEGEEIDRIGIDTNGDGQVDLWQKKQPK